MSQLHLQDELAKSQASVTIQTQYGPITGGRALNGAAVFLGKGSSYDQMEYTQGAHVYP